MRITAVLGFLVMAWTNVWAAADGKTIYEQTCATCHANPDIRAPRLSAMKSMSGHALLFALTEGKMKWQASALNDAERLAIVEYLAGSLAPPSNWEAAVACEVTETPVTDASVRVPGWGYGNDNRRYQRHAGVPADWLPIMELAWAHGFPGVTEMRSQPVMTEDTVYAGAGNGVYAFDLETGCLRWSFKTRAPVRSSIGFGRLPDGETPVLYWGDVGGNVHVIRATDGTGVWSASVKTNETSTVTGTPVQHGERLYVPLSNFGVAAARNPRYPCCKGRGGVTALDMMTGETIWTYHTVPPAEPTGEKNSRGQVLWGPSGAPVWTTPAIDEKRGVLYVGTGENYSRPTTGTSDAIIALDLDTGEPRWIFQALEGDAYNMDCAGWVGGRDGPNCPEDSGPDFDFGASVVIATDADGNDILLAGQKSGDVWALDPDDKGKVLWRRQLSEGTPVGGVHWGMSVVGDTVFVPIADPEWPITGWEYSPRPGVAALDVTTGEVKWRHEASRDCEFNPAAMRRGQDAEPWPECHFLYGFSGAAVGIDGAVLAGALNGKLYAFDADDGSILWEYDTKRSFVTLNGIEAHGGSLDNANVATGAGHVVVGSGYSYIDQMPGNVLLVFRLPPE